MPTRLTAVLSAVALSAPLPAAHADPAATPRTTPVVAPAARTRPARPPRDPHRVPDLAAAATAITRVAAATTVRRPKHTHRYASRPKPKPVHRYDPLVDAPHTDAGLRQFAAAAGWPWTGIIGCESEQDGSWRESSGSWARGILQFLPSTWESLGLSGDPAAASWREQLAAAVRLRARDGLRAWDCAVLLGYA